MGDAKNHDLQVSFDSRLKLKFLNSQITTDAERLSVDPAMRHVVGGRAMLPEKQAASTSEVGRFETEIINTSSELQKLMDLSSAWIDTVPWTLELMHLAATVFPDGPSAQDSSMRFLSRRQSVCWDWALWPCSADSNGCPRRSRHSRLSACPAGGPCGT